MLQFDIDLQIYGMMETGLIRGRNKRWPEERERERERQKDLCKDKDRYICIERERERERREVQLINK